MTRTKYIGYTTPDGQRHVEQVSATLADHLEALGLADTKHIFTNTTQED